MKNLAIATLASVLLAGCQSLFGSAAKLEVRPAGAPLEASAAIALEEGRQHLERREVASAIVALRAAMLDPATAATAHNGLGVAYALLDRGDLAERYFRRAIELDSADPRFAANLARFYASREAALAKANAALPPVIATSIEPTETPQSLAAAPAPRLLVAGPSVVRIELPTPASSMTRISRREVVIRTASAAAPIAVADARRRNPRFSAAPAGAEATYPIRIALPPTARR